MLRHEIVDYVDAFVASFDPPLREGVAVKSLRSNPQHGFTLETTDGLYGADQVVIAAGGYQIPVIPRCAERLDPELAQINSSEYRNPEQLPAGPVLVVGSGQSGCQIAEDLHIAGRKVHLCVGDAPRVARRYRGKDVVEWLHLMGYYDLPVHEHPLREGVRDKTNHYVTGRDGGRDIDLRQRALEGMELYGRLLDVSGDRLMLDDDLAQCLDQADQVSESIKTSIDGFIAKRGIAAPRRGALQTGMDAVARARGARLPRGRHQRRSSGASAFAPTIAGSTCRSSTAAGSPLMSAASRRLPAFISSACRGSTPGARGGFPGCRATPNISPSTSRRGSA